MARARLETINTTRSHSRFYAKASGIIVLVLSRSYSDSGSRGIKYFPIFSCPTHKRTKTINEN